MVVLGGGITATVIGTKSLIPRQSTLQSPEASRALPVTCRDHLRTAQLTVQGVVPVSAPWKGGPSSVERCPARRTASSGEHG